MKTTKLLLAAAVLTLNFWLQTFNCSAQNLISNPSFEDFSSCPTFVGQSTNANNWTNPASGTPDYFNTCNGKPPGCSSFNVNVPDNLVGTQAARNGSGYMGVYTYQTNSPADRREYIQQLFSPALTAGVTYQVSFYVSRADGGTSTCISSPTSTNNQGAYISATAPSSITESPLPFTPQINNSGAVISDATGWTLVSGPYTSVLGGEQYITIGNFFTDAATTVTAPGASTKAYYYIDDVCITPNGGTGCGSFGLPISLLSFTGTCTAPLSMGEGSGVRINWSTATETNNDYFTIERSTAPDPSKGGGLNWEAAGTVKGAGNSSTVRSYEFIDNQVLPFGEDLGGVVYYRLTQTDYDGKTEVFNSKQVAVDITECAVQVFPNPAGNTLNIPYTAEQDGEINLQVYDVIGKLVKDKTVTALKGNNKFTLDLTTVAQGMYVLRVKNGVKENNQKFVRQ